MLGANRRRNKTGGRKKKKTFFSGSYFRGNISLSVSASGSTHFLIAAAAWLTHRSCVHTIASNEQCFSEILRARLLLCILRSGLLGLKVYERNIFKFLRYCKRYFLLSSWKILTDQLDTFQASTENFICSSHCHFYSGKT